VKEADARPIIRMRGTVEYDGSGFAGSQFQPDLPTVQGELEAVLSRLFDRPTRVVLAGRTDAGVHATAQEIGFDAPDRWSPDRLRDAMNALLGDRIRIWTVGRAEHEFHPRFSATGRRYEYFVGDSEEALSPLRGGRIWQLGTPLEIDALSAASVPLTGTGDYTGLSRSGQPERGTKCTVERVTWLRTAGGDLRFEIVADRFLHHMVRYLVTVLVEIAMGTRAENELRQLLEGRGPAAPPRPAPAEGLYLTGVRYRDGWNRRPGVAGLWPASHRTTPGHMHD
jgi:tRNA pseudouridine38-40 synthase